MDIKKLYDFEYMLENMRPEFTEAELLDAVSTGDNKSTREVASISVASGVDGIYVKSVDKDGNHSEMQNLNPIVAERLAFELLEALKSMGADHLDAVLNGSMALPKNNLH